MSGRWTSRAIDALRVELTEIEDYATTLPWAATTAWTTRGRVSTERRLRIRRERDQRIVKVDLHGLDAKGADLACARIREHLAQPDHPLRYVRVVVGKGKRSTQGRRVLAGVAARVLVPDGAIAVRSSTIGASDGYLDAWNRDKWPRPRLRSSRR